MTELLDHPVDQYASLRQSPAFDQLAPVLQGA